MSSSHRRLQRIYELVEARRTHLEQKHRGFRARPWRLLSGSISWLEYIVATGRLSLSIVTVAIWVVIAGYAVYSQLTGKTALSVLSLLALVASALPGFNEAKKLKAAKRSLILGKSDYALSDPSLELGDGVRESHTICVFRKEQVPDSAIQRRGRRHRRWGWKRDWRQPQPTRLPNPTARLTEESVYCVYPKVIAALLTSPDQRGPQIFFGRDDKPLHKTVKEHKSAIILHKYDNKVRPFNGRTVSQCRDIDQDFANSHAKVDFKPSRYFDLLCGDYLVAQRLVRDDDVELDGINLVSEVGSDGVRRLLPLEQSKSSNSVGVSTVAFDAFGRLILILQGEAALSSAGLLAPSGSGSLEPRDYDSAVDYLEKHVGPEGPTSAIRLADLVIEGMERELIEEANIHGTWIAKSHLTGYYRWLSKGGKPEYCGVTRLQEPIEVLKRRVSEHNWVRRILVVEVDHRALKSDPASPAAALTLRTTDRQELKISEAAELEPGDDFDPLSRRLSTPLLLCLRFYGEYLNAHSIDPDSYFWHEIFLAGSRFFAMSHVHGLPWKDHDRALVTRCFAGIGDGATPLMPSWPSPTPLVTAGLAALAASATDECEVHDLWRQAIRHASGGLSVPGQPSAAMAAVRGFGADIEVSLLGDCIVLVKLRGNARTVRLTDSTVVGLDATALHIEDVAERHAKLVDNRRKMNQDYWIFANDVCAADHILASRYRVDEVQLVLIASDGLEPVLKAEFGIADASAWISKSTSQEVRSVLHALQSRSCEGRIESAQDDFSWVLLWPPTEIKSG